MKLRKEVTLFDSYDYFDIEDKAWDELWQYQIDEGYYTEEELTDDVKYELLSNEESLDWDMVVEELKSLDKKLPYRHYVVAGCIGRWNGNFNGWKIIDNLEDALYMDCDYYTVTVDKNGLHIRGVHHDGSNEVTVWGVKPQFDEYEIEDWLYKIKHGKLWYKCDNLVPYICEYYGYKGGYGIKGVGKRKIEKAKEVMR